MLRSPCRITGKKGGAGDSDGFIKNQPDLEFYKNLPTVWDETIVLEGEIGKFVTIARRSGDNWFLGSLTADTSKTIHLSFNFLQKDLMYKVKIYSFDLYSESSIKVNIEKVILNSKTTINF